MLDLLILGAGPAGLALAAQARRRGLQVAVMAPDPMRPWTQTLCAWTDELPDVPLSAHWSRVRVKVDSEREFDRSYGLLANRALQAKLAEGIELVRGSCTGVDHYADYSEINGVRARLVVDATGHDPALLTRGRPLGWQTAYGREIRVDHGLPVDTATFMEFHEGPTPTFLYALPMGPDRLFVEETSLIGRQPPLFEFLANRLHGRLDAMKLDGPTLRTERCLFPMGVPIPEAGRVIGFGAAAGMVHPATGYSVGRTLRAAARVADALDMSLAPDDAARKAWDAVWPRSARQARALHMLGADILARLDAPQTRAFFESFFQLPMAQWASYLDADQVPVTPMLRFFAAADNGVRLSLMAAGFDAVRAA